MDSASPEYIVRTNANADLVGVLWFSPTQWKQLRDKEAPRTFGMLPSGQIVEYTELITLEQISCGDVSPLETDSELIGPGVFHHHILHGEKEERR